MKITFTCKLTISDDVPESFVERIKPADVIAESLIYDLKDGLSENGVVNISDANVSTN